MRWWLKFLLVLLLAGELNAMERLRAVDGVLQGHSWNFQTQGPVQIKGEWRFYPNILLEPEAMRGLAFWDQPHQLIANGTSWQAVAGREVSRATVAIKISGLTDEGAALSIHFDQFCMQHETWFYRPKTGELMRLASVGQMAEAAAPEIQQMKSVQVALPKLMQEDFYLISRVTRYEIAPQFTMVPEIDHSENMLSREERKTWQSFFVLGMFFLLGISNLGLYVLRPEDRPSLLIGLFALLMGLRYFSTEALLARFIPEPSWITFTCTVLPIGWSLSLGLSLYFSFFNQTFRQKLSPRLVRFNWYLMIVMVVLTLLSPAKAGNVVILTLLFQFLIAGLVVYHLIRLIRKNVRSAAMAFAGFTLLFLSIVNDTLVQAAYVYDAPFLGHYGMVAFIFCQSLVVGSNFAHAFRTAERLSQNLQQEVDQQTERLRMQKEKLEEQKRILEDQKKQLIVAHDELKDVDDQKTKFFRSISHELRTPLTLILGSLREQLQPMDMPAAVDMARRNAKRLFRLVNQLLDFQKIALAKFKIRLEPIPLQQFIQNVASSCDEACQRKRITFTVSMDPPAAQTLQIMGQIDALEKIVFNYLANALKYAPEGGRIELILERRAHRVRISVVDDGPGIPEDQQDKLFKLFSQVEGRHQQDKQGTGLGLALVKELAQLMQGSVGVESRTGQGARFWAEFPLVLSGDEAIDILLVDPDPQRSMQLLKLLDEGMHFWNIMVTGSLDEAAQRMRQQGARVILMLIDAGTELNSFLKASKEWQPDVWRVLLSESGRVKQDAIKQLQTSEVEHFQLLPLSAEFLRELEQKLHRPLPQHLPILDLVYVEDEAAIRNEFTLAMERHTALLHYRTVANGEGLKKLLRTHRLRVVIADANLVGEQGTDLLALLARVSPDTFRIILTGETSTQVMADSISKAQAHHILYKPCDYRKELRLIEEYIRKSPMTQVVSEAAAPTDRDWHFAGLDQARILLTPEEQRYERPEGSKGVVLVVDDVFDMRGIVTAMLRSHGYHVLAADGGAQALQIVEQHPQLIDLVITDWLMPGIDGPTLIDSLHQREESASLPTILLTAKTDSESKAEGIRIGASAYLGKPFDEMELLSTVENLLDLKKRERKIEDLNRFINQNILQRYLPPELVKDLVAGKAIFDDQARMRPVTIMFADLCNFTRSTEILGPSRIASILNDFFVRMTDVIFEHGGTIDKFLGDGILTLFGAPLAMDPAEQARRASECAKAMMAALDELNDTWRIEHRHDFAMRIGLHHGPAIVGSFGGQKRSDYTAIGHTVNIAARVQVQAEPGQILMTAAVREALPDNAWVAAGTFTLKGVDGEVPLFALVLTPPPGSVCSAS